MRQSAEDDAFDLGKAYFDSKELERCAWALKGCTGVKASFLRRYAQYLVSGFSWSLHREEKISRLPRFRRDSECRQAVTRGSSDLDGFVADPSGHITCGGLTFSCRRDG